MFDNYTKNNIKINAISGTIVKNYQKSFMIHFERKSNVWDNIQGDKPQYANSKTGRLKDIVILQIMILGDDLFIAEVMWKEDFEEMFKNEEK